MYVAGLIDKALIRSGLNSLTPFSIGILFIDTITSPWRNLVSYGNPNNSPTVKGIFVVP